MKTNTAAPKLTKAQERLQLRKEIDRLLARCEMRGRSFVVFPKHLLIAARKP